MDGEDRAAALVHGVAGREAECGNGRVRNRVRRLRPVAFAAVVRAAARALDLAERLRDLLPAAPAAVRIALRLRRRHRRERGVRHGLSERLQHPVPAVRVRRVGDIPRIVAPPLHLRDQAGIRLRRRIVVVGHAHRGRRGPADRVARAGLDCCRDRAVRLVGGIVRRRHRERRAAPGRDRDVPRARLARRRVVTALAHRHRHRQRRRRRGRRRHRERGRTALRHPGPARDRDHGKGGLLQAVERGCHRVPARPAPAGMRPGLGGGHAPGVAVEGRQHPLPALHMVARLRLLADIARNVRAQRPEIAGRRARLERVRLRAGLRQVERYRGREVGEGLRVAVAVDVFRRHRDLERRRPRRVVFDRPGRAGHPGVDAGGDRLAVAVERVPRHLVARGVRHRVPACRGAVRIDLRHLEVRHLRGGDLDRGRVQGRGLGVGRQDGAAPVAVAVVVRVVGADGLDRPAADAAARGRVREVRAGVAAVPEQRPHPDLAPALPGGGRGSRHGPRPPWSSRGSCCRRRCWASRRPRHSRPRRSPSANSATGRSGSAPAARRRCSGSRSPSPCRRARGGSTGGSRSPAAPRGRSPAAARSPASTPPCAGGRASRCRPRCRQPGSSPPRPPPPARRRPATGRSKVLPLKAGSVELNE